ncbi:MAG: NADH-quinone oxidoreductase subunit A, partial [Planctomycetota bacterium]
LAVDLDAYLPIGILVLIALGFAAGNLIVTHLFGARKEGPRKNIVYESGMNPIGTARKRFNVRFYILAMTFLVFDVEIIFLYPWAVTFAKLAPRSPEAALFRWPRGARRRRSSSVASCSSSPPRSSPTSTPGGRASSAGTSRRQLTGDCPPFSESSRKKEGLSPGKGDSPVKSPEAAVGTASGGGKGRSPEGSRRGKEQTLTR